MKTTSPILKGVIVAFIIAGIIFFWVSMRQNNNRQDAKQNSSSLSIIDHKSGGLVDVKSPLPGTRVSSPIVVKGSASGSWFYEGSFPVEVLDSKHVVIGKGIATSTFDWMTMGFIPFRASIIVKNMPLSGTEGSILLKRDNPSGDSTNDQAIEVPIIFN